MRPTAINEPVQPHRSRRNWNERLRAIESKLDRLLRKLGADERTEPTLRDAAAATISADSRREAETSGANAPPSAAAKRASMQWPPIRNGSSYTGDSLSAEVITRTPSRIE